MFPMVSSIDDLCREKFLVIKILRAVARTRVDHKFSRSGRGRFLQISQLLLDEGLLLLLALENLGNLCLLFALSVSHHL